MHLSKAQAAAWPRDFSTGTSVPVAAVRALASLCDFAADGSAVYCTRQTNNGTTEWTVLAVSEGWLTRVTCSVPPGVDAGSATVEASTTRVAEAVRRISVESTYLIDDWGQKQWDTQWSAIWLVELVEGDALRLPEGEISAAKRDDAERVIRALLGS